MAQGVLALVLLALAACANARSLRAAQHRRAATGAAAESAAPMLPLRIIDDDAGSADVTALTTTAAALLRRPGGGAAAAAPAPQYTVALYAGQPLAPLPGQTYKRYALISNTGLMPTRRIAVQAWGDYKNGDAAPGCGARGDASAIVPALNPGQSKLLEFSLKAPATPGAGKQWVVLVDSKCKVADESQIVGGRAQGAPYAVAAAPVADLAVAVFAADAQLYATPGRNFAYTFQVCNYGTAPAPAVPGGMQVDILTAEQAGAFKSPCTGAQPSAPPAPEFSPASDIPRPLNPGWCFKFSSAVQPKALGAFWLGATVDPACAVHDGGAQNNAVALGPFAAVAAPGFPFLVPTITRLEPRRPRPGATMTVTIEISNAQGNVGGAIGSVAVWADGGALPAGNATCTAAGAAAVDEFDQAVRAGGADWAPVIQVQVPAPAGRGRWYKMYASADAGCAGAGPAGNVLSEPFYYRVG